MLHCSAQAGFPATENCSKKRHRPWLDLVRRGYHDWGLFTTCGPGTRMVAALCRTAQYWCGRRRPPRRGEAQKKLHKASPSSLEFSRAAVVMNARGAANENEEAGQGLSSCSYDPTARQWRSISAAGLSDRNVHPPSKGTAAKRYVAGAWVEHREHGICGEMGQVCNGAETKAPGEGEIACED
jgi:hypothetical protein